MFTTVCSAAVYGLQAYLVRVEVDLAEIGRAHV